MERLEERKRLIKLLDSIQTYGINEQRGMQCSNAMIVNYLLSNDDIIVLPCKVGDTAYYIYKRWGEDYYISECKVRGISTDYYGKETQIYLKIRYTDYNGNKDNTTALLGRNVFLSIKEAEKELERLKSGGSNEYINKD